MKQRLFPLLISICMVLLVGLAWSRSGSYMGPRTGAPGEGDCTDCHAGVVNSGSGSVGLSAPPEYVPDDTLNLSVTLANISQIRWGFEITALDASDQPVGQFIISDATNTQMNTDVRQYVFHTSTGTYDGTADASPGWTFRWIAPTSGSGAVTFWLVGLASNSAQGTDGDSTYTTSRSVNEALATSADDPTGPSLPGSFVLSQNYPNPFNPATTIEYNVPSRSQITIEVFNIFGQKIKTLVDESKPAGEYQVIWDGKDMNAHKVATGVYLYRFQTDDYVETRKMILLK